MNRTEKLVAAAVLVVNLSVGIALIARSDYSSLVGGAPQEVATAAALSPAPSP